jgi:DNA repair exonuclease SbcCD ATPase subunit
MRAEPAQKRTSNRRVEGVLTISMALLLNHRDHIDRIEGRIEALRDRAAKLHEREQRASRRAEELRSQLEGSTRRVSRTRYGRALRRSQARHARLRTKREELVASEVRAILLALQEQSQRTRLRLDRELSRLEPIEAEWERMREAFGTLQSAVATPAVERLAEQWTGELEIPDFPVAEHEGYIKPFPRRAMVF